MNGLGSFFTSNWLFVALANIGGVAGLVILIGTSLKYVYRFCSSIWQNNLSITISRYKMAGRRSVALSARDMHVYFSIVAYRLLYLLMIIAASAVGSFTFIIPESSVLMREIGPHWIYEMTSDFTAIFVVLYLISAVFIASSSARFIVAVRDRRAKLRIRYMKKRRPRAVEWPYFL